MDEIDDLRESCQRALNAHREFLLPRIDRLDEMSPKERKWFREQLKRIPEFFEGLARH
jgi:hypothetical protein